MKVSTTLMSLKAQKVSKKEDQVRQVLTTGNYACAQGAINIGCRFFAGYPITPSSEIAAAMAKMLPKVGGVFIQMEDEIASIMACIGASFGGKKVMTATSGPGFSLMLENLSLAAMMEAPLVIVTVMRGGPSTGQPTKTSQSDVFQVRYGAHGDYEIIALAPASVQEMYDLTIRAFNLSEKYRTPVILVSDATISQMMEPVVYHDNFEIVERKKPTVPPSEYKPFEVTDDDLVPPMAIAGTDYDFYVTGLTHDEHGNPRMDPEWAEKLSQRICEKILRARPEINDWVESYLEDATTAVLSYGINARGALEAVAQCRNRGLPVGMVRMRSLWPFPEELMERLHSLGIKKVIVTEMNQGRILREVERFRHYFDVVGICKPTTFPMSPSYLHERIVKEVS